MEGSIAFKVEDEESCYFIARSLYNITMEQFRDMNPDLRDRCNIVTGQDVTVPCTNPHQVVENRKSMCRHFVPVKDTTCDGISILHSISVGLLKKYNHDILNEGCIFKKLTTLCVFTMDLRFECKKYHDVEGDTCRGIADNNGITMRNLEDWNPDLIERTCGIREGQRVCVEGDAKESFLGGLPGTKGHEGPGPGETEFDQKEEHNHDDQEANQEEETEPDETEVDQEEKRQQTSSVSHDPTSESQLLEQNRKLWQRR